MSVEDLQAEVIAACRKHEEQKLQNSWPGNVDHRVCAFVGADYFVKYGGVKYIKPELATQEYLFHYAQQPQTPEPPRIAKIVHHFVSQNTMYLVMERIKLQVSPPDLETRIQGAIEWLSKVPPPPNSKLGPVGGGLIRHRLFKDYEAPFIFSDTAMLDLYMLKAYGVLSKAGKKKSSPVSVQGERLMFTQSDMHDSNFGVDENGRTVLMDFNTVGLLPESFIAFTLCCDKKFAPIAASLGLSGNSKLYSMAAIAYILAMVADPTFDMKMVSEKNQTDGASRQL